METINRLNLNGTNGNVKASKPRKASKRKPKLASSVNMNRTRTIITIAAGCSIPLLSLALSYMGGSLLTNEASMALALTLLTLCCVVLAVSLSHLAWAISDITRSPMWASWCLAIAVDATLVACELSSSLGYGSMIVSTTIFAVTLASMVLNCWAFLRNAK